jgi:competence protein ComEC
MHRHLRSLRLAALLALALPSSGSAQAGPVQVVFLDVGQGDAVVVRAPEGQTALIDAGPGVDLTAALERLGIAELDLVVASHPHADHIGGMWRDERA